MISVIIPTYKPRPYLWCCLDSFCQQSLPCDEFEILLVLNGPRHPYQQQIEQYLQQHPGLNCTFFYSERKGVSAARNVGIDHAQGEYITFVDDDDFVSPTYLEELRGVSSPTCIGLAYIYSFIDCDFACGTLPPQQPYSLTSEYERHSPFGRQRALRPYRYFAGPVLKLIHRSIIGQRRFDERFCNMEDVLFCFEISDKYQFACFTSRQAIYYRRMRPDSAAHHRSVFKRTYQSLRAIAAYTAVYLHSPSSYSFSFYLTRVLGAIKGALTRDA